MLSTSQSLPREKHILIVDDEPNLVKFLSKSLKKLGNDYIIDVAHTPKEALNKIEKHPYTLLLTDYMMPGMNGVELIQTTRQVSPETRCVLMSAYYSTNILRQKAKQLEITAYIDKPFTTKQIRELVRQGIDQASPQVEVPAEIEPIPQENIVFYLRQLQANTGARCVLLAQSNGHPLEIVGQTDGIDIEKMTTLITTNFVAATQLARLLDDQETAFKSSYQEGSNHNIYTYAINHSWILTVVFDARIKPGVVWFYSKQTAEALQPLSARYSAAQTAQSDQGTTADRIVNELEQQLEPDIEVASKPKDGLPKTGTAVRNSQSKSKLKRQRRHKTLSFPEAVNAGLVPPHILSREETD